MKSWISVLMLTFVYNASAGWKKESREILREYEYACQSTKIYLDEIQRDHKISGRVEGLPADAYSKFKMVFYVKTNFWYVHPYAYYEGQEEGYSYSLLNEKGEFQIKTVRRDIPAKELAAVLVPLPYKIRDQRWWLHPALGFLGGVLQHDCSYLRVEGNGDF